VDLARFIGPGRPSAVSAQSECEQYQVKLPGADAVCTSE